MSSKQLLAAFCYGAGLVALAAVPVLALSHDAGHGPRIEGVGKNGGKLTAVISAAEAELGEKAAVRAVAEWTRKGDELKIQLWDAKKTAAIALPASSEIKWIVLGDKGTKPQVLVSALKSSTAELAHSFDAGTLDRATLVEVILPGKIGTSEGKHVFVMKLK